MVQGNCFAFRRDDHVAYCDALTKLKCDGCPFYKPADTVQYYERTENGRTFHGYQNKTAAHISRLEL